MSFSRTCSRRNGSHGSFANGSNRAAARLCGQYMPQAQSPNIHAKRYADGMLVQVTLNSILVYKSPTAALENPQRPPGHMPQFVVVGAGPAGCTAALRAARTPDVQVTVIEKRSFDSIFTSRNSPRSYPMVLSGRALQTLKELQLDLPSTREPYYGMQFMPSNGTMSMPGAAIESTRTRDALRHADPAVVSVAPSRAF